MMHSEVKNTEGYERHKEKFMCFKDLVEQMKKSHNFLRTDGEVFRKGVLNSTFREFLTREDTFHALRDLEEQRVSEIQKRTE